MHFTFLSNFIKRQYHLNHLVLNLRRVHDFLLLIIYICLAGDLRLLLLLLILIWLLSLFILWILNAFHPHEIIWLLIFEFLDNIYLLVNVIGDVFLIEAAHWMNGLTFRLVLFGGKHIWNRLLIHIDKFAIVVELLILSQEFGILAIVLVVVVLKSYNISLVDVHGIFGLCQSKWHLNSALFFHLLQFLIKVDQFARFKIMMVVSIVRVLFLDLAPGERLLLFDFWWLVLLFLFLVWTPIFQRWIPLQERCFIANRAD